MFRSFRLFALAACLLGAFSSKMVAAGDESNPDRVYIPADAGLVNVRDHGLVGDGRTDDTSALLKLVRANLNKHKTLFFPAGPYLLTNSIPWAITAHFQSILQGFLSTFTRIQF
jgi:hypothetical protein